MTDLIDAVLDVDVARIKELIESGADVNAKDEDGKTALMYIVSFEHLGKSCKSRLQEKIIKHIQTMNNENEIILIHKNGLPMSAKADDINEGEVSINDDVWEYSNETYKAGVIRYLAQKDHIFELLVSAGADIHATSNTGAVAFLFASQGEGVTMLEKLLDLGCDINVQDSRGSTALMGAAYAGLAEITVFLLKNGADTSTIGLGGITALSLAEKQGHEEIIAILKKHQ